MYTRDMNIDSPLFTAQNNWTQVWPLAERRGQFATWAEQTSYIKATEYFKGSGVFAKLFKLPGIQSRLQAQYNKVQEQINLLAGDSQVIYAHTPVFSKEIATSGKEVVYVDFFVTMTLIGFDPNETLDSYKIQAEQMYIKNPGDSVTEVSVQGYRALLTNIRIKNDDGSFGRSVRQYTIESKTGKEVVQFTVQTILEDEESQLEATTQALIDSLVITDHA